MPYAFDDFRNLAGRLIAPVANDDHLFWYCAALCADLAYSHVPQFEIGARQRAKVVPSEAYQSIIRRRKSTDVVAHLRGLTEGEGPPPFAVATQNVIAIGIPIDDKLFIAYRGTRLNSVYDWGVNLSASQAPLPGSAEALHRGFFREAMDITLELAPIITTYLERSNSWRRVFACGHSLGGAVAAISADILHRKFNVHFEATCIFGTPRYCNHEFIRDRYALPNRPPIHIRRRGDFVPDIPARALGYADLPIEYDPHGPSSLLSSRSLGIKAISGLFFLLPLLATPHFMDRYRKELGAIWRYEPNGLKLTNL